MTISSESTKFTFLNGLLLTSMVTLFLITHIKDISNYLFKFMRVIFHHASSRLFIPPPFSFTTIGINTPCLTQLSGLFSQHGPTTSNYFSQFQEFYHSNSTYRSTPLYSHHQLDAHHPSFKASIFLLFSKYPLQRILPPKLLSYIS